MKVHRRPLENYGTMTGQILILFLIAGVTGLGVMASVSVSLRRFFDTIDCLRIELLSN